MKAKIQKYKETNWQTKKSNKVCVLPNEYLSPSEYIDNLIDQLRQDIFPLFRVGGSAPFTISRNIFCFIDHISVLKYGYGNMRGGQTERIKKLISEFANFDSYIQSKYERYASYIVQVYRHDLVHNVRPFPHKFDIINKTVKKQKYISWFFVSSEIDKNYQGRKTFKKLTKHFINTKNRKNLCHLRYIGNQIVINNYCLFFDFVNFLKEYQKLLRNNKKLRDKFINNYQKIINNHFEINNFILDKRKDKECKIL